MLSPSRNNLRAWTPSTGDAAFLASVDGTSKFLDNLPDAIRRQYGGQWIAAKDSAIIASAPTRAELIDQLGERDDETVLKLKLEKGVTIRWRQRS